MRDHVRRKHGLGAGLPQVDLLDLFTSFDESVTPYAFLEGGSSTIDLALLKAFARRYERCRYFEIGSWRGESVANVASVASECISPSWSELQKLPRARAVDMPGRLGLDRGRYSLVTLHRPSNVHEPGALRVILVVLGGAA